MAKAKKTGAQPTPTTSKASGSKTPSNNQAKKAGSASSKPAARKKK